ncbi:4'-phosphopantetheinyl transferase superfamily protein [Corallococcus sp. M34]|uniref:holo-ACP synthase n=1 Tax=Citreicoccus inhibens TaxID=2849499 RepID=UPI0013154A51|nr:4'-phosphopantetheinyl transferase superfamily protein [Citreicoccus inhibens]MBU8896866.1 4'-phosphopantetheinyl transferase superfamily protein [Citreicoccus inhibens]
MDGSGRVLIGLGHDLQAVHELESVEGLREPGVFFTQAELAHFARASSPHESLAAGFSAKEALFKALPPVDGWFWTDAELHHDARHAPRFEFHGALREHAEREGWHTLLSLSHSGGFVSTVVVVTLTPRP